MDGQGGGWVSYVTLFVDVPFAVCKPVDALVAPFDVVGGDVVEGYVQGSRSAQHQPS